MDSISVQGLIRVPHCPDFPKAESRVPPAARRLCVPESASGVGVGGVFPPDSAPSAEGSEAYGQAERLGSGVRLPGPRTSQGLQGSSGGHAPGCRHAVL